MPNPSQTKKIRNNGVSLWPQQAQTLTPLIILDGVFYKTKQMQFAI